MMLVFNQISSIIISLTSAFHRKHLLTIRKNPIVDLGHFCRDVFVEEATAELLR